MRVFVTVVRTSKDIKRAKEEYKEWLKQFRENSVPLSTDITPDIISTINFVDELIERDIETLLRITNMPPRSRDNNTRRY